MMITDADAGTPFAFHQVNLAYQGIIIRTREDEKA